MMLPTMEMRDGDTGWCTGCELGNYIVRSYRPSADHPRVTFRVFGCPRCGHLMTIDAGKLRDLTRAEADELAASPDFPRVRERVLEAVGHLIG